MRLVLILEAQANFQGHLKVSDVVFFDMTPDRDDLEPIEVAERTVSTCDAILDSSVHSLGRRPDDFVDTVGVGGHGNSLCLPLSGRVAISS